MKSSRHDKILRCLSVVGTLAVEEAVVRFDASAATVRRDFNQLADAQLVQRVRGGIRLLGNGQAPPFAMREIRQAEEKLAIAQRVTSLLSPDDVVFVDGGTTTLQLTSCLPPVPLRIITNSLNLAASLESHATSCGRWEVFLTGGFLFPGSGLLVGPSAQAGIAQYHANWALISASGITPLGIFNDNEHVVESERVMIAHADRVAVLADHTKFERAAMCHIVGLDQIDVVVTDRVPQDESLLQQFDKDNVEIMQA